MSCKISRRNFMRCAGIGALALASTSLLGGCTKFDAEYRLNEVATFTDKDGGTLRMVLADAKEITAARNTNLAENYQLKIDDTQRYVYLRFDVENNTGAPIELYNKRYNPDWWFEKDYTDEMIREHFYEYEDEDGTVQHSTYPIASRMVEAPGVIWAYNNGMYLSDGKFGMVCHTGAAGEPREANTYADAPVGRSYIECIGQITENTQTIRLVYRTARTEVNFVLYPSELG